MQPQEPFDLPDAALPGIEPIMPPDPAPVPQPPAVPEPQAWPEAPAPIPAPAPPVAPQNPLLPNNASAATQAADGNQGRSHLTHVGQKYFELIEFDSEEVLLAEIRKHPFGLFVIVATGSLIALALFIALTALASSSFLTDLGLGSSIRPVIVFSGFLLSLFIIMITLINAHLYRNNVVFVTNEKLAQVLFITLFNRKISQLSIGDVQDVTVSQNGFLPNLIGYGTLVVETAGEQQNYTFSFVPKPYENSKVIINAHESNLKQYGN